MAEIRKIENIDEYNSFVALSGETLSVVKVGTDFCGPCKVLESILKDLTDEEVEGVNLAEVNADEEWFEDKAAEIRIRTIPVLLAFKQGAEIDRLQGGVSREKVLEFFDRNK